MPRHVFDMTCERPQRAQNNKRPPLTLTLSPYLIVVWGEGTHF